MKWLYDPLWIAVAVVLSILVAVLGYPAFEERFGFPESLFWTTACVAGVWLTYLVRAYFWSQKTDRK